jgi:hypothetical protein
MSALFGTDFCSLFHLIFRKQILLFYCSHSCVCSHCWTAWHSLFDFLVRLGLVNPITAADSLKYGLNVCSMGRGTDEASFIFLFTVGARTLSQPFVYIKPHSLKIFHLYFFVKTFGKKRIT